MQVDQQLRPSGSTAQRTATEEPAPPPERPAQPPVLVRVALADQMLLCGLLVLTAATLGYDVASSGRPALELLLAAVLGPAFGITAHRLIGPAQAAIWRPAAPVPNGVEPAGMLAALPRAAALTLIPAAVVVLTAVLLPGVGLSLVLIGLSLALGLRVVSLQRWEHERGRLLYTRPTLHPLPREYRSRPRL